MSDRPNVLYIFTDQQSGDAMGCAGNEDLQTPAMDEAIAQIKALPGEGVMTCPTAAGGSLYFIKVTFEEAGEALPEDHSLAGVIDGRLRSVKLQ